MKIFFFGQNYNFILKYYDFFLYFLHFFSTYFNFILEISKCFWVFCALTHCSK